ncbi:hypothetical protein EVAR_100960_1 [Eumeta japonica]|uniref:Uncharacterized protein n=1 Tax=Eumeta variegata TaxID=151549 RepID=A0A4C2AGV8_EUMVA|nr:hypothetical protein EVAR_100960_1 [Eumeta japonica]
MEVEFNPVKEPSKRHAVRPSEDSTSDSDPGWSDVSDHLRLHYSPAPKTSRTKPEAFHTQATDGSTYFRSLGKYPSTRSRKTYALKNLGAVSTSHTEPLPRALDLVLVSAQANDKVTKATFFQIRSVCFSEIKAEQTRKRRLTQVP